MEKDIEKLFGDSAKIALSASEKEETRRFLVAYAAMKPVRDASPVRQQGYRATAAAAASLFTRKFMPVFSMLLAASLALGGVSYAAEGALPGDALYPMKVSVNEEVRAALTVSPKAKAQWEARRAERRLEEAENLAAGSRLDADARADIEERLTIHAARVSERVDDLEDRQDFETAVEVSSQLEGALSAHRKILARIGGKAKGEQRSEIAALAATVDVEAASVSETRFKNEDVVTSGNGAKVKVAAEAKMDVAAKFIAATHEILAAESRLGTEATADARARLVAADDAYAEGRDRLKNGESGEAFLLFQQAHRASREARVLVRAEGRVSAEAERRQKKEKKEEEKERKQEERREDGSRDRSDRDQEVERDQEDDENDEDKNEVEVDAEVRINGGVNLDLGL